ncbi:ankyrin repeat-containing protein ITN1-like [Neltuma alba]|uniref:ankyrin repeat-containing protein ITN1-like n=1 Tax=Neltuma alba TaxID=207710 RepID=UPI0010A351C0|nr:ankyrin repeat-containing protein ITN1-like [Prosopis alba]
MKLQQAQANEHVDLVCGNANKKDEAQTIANALFRAVKEGNVEFVVKISKANPEILLSVDNSYRNIFYLAIEHRQARVFNLFHELHFKDAFACSKDIFGNTLLRAAAAKAPDIILNRIYGPALQMQRELKWFKEVESITPPSFRVLQNTEGVTVEESFREHHRELMKQGEEWIKAIASSYSLVGILIVTITFAVVFTLPGGNDQNSGLPLFIKQTSFDVFILSTIVSLVASSTSVLMFLAILTSPFSEEAFLNFLPSKLLFGVSTLLTSMVAMIITFLSAIHLTLKHSNYHGAILPIILFTSVPISYSLLSLIPVVRNTAFSAYGTVFNRKVGLLL